MARKILTDRMVAKLEPSDRRQQLADPELPSHYVRVEPSGSKTYYCQARDPAGRQVWTRIGATERLTIAAARETAKRVFARIGQGLTAFEAPPVKPVTFGEVAAEWYKRHVVEKGVINTRVINSSLKNNLLPAWKDVAFIEIRRNAVNELLDTIVDRGVLSGPRVVGGGKRAADTALWIFRSMCNWYALRNEAYLSPIIKGMYRGKKIARERVLTDEEIRLFWAAGDREGVKAHDEHGRADVLYRSGCLYQYSSILRLCLLTAQRSERVFGMLWEDLDGDVWHVTHEGRQKRVGGYLRLPEMAMAIIIEQNSRETSPYVFPGRSNIGHRWRAAPTKDAFDKRCGFTGWTVHDLRRTAQTLMSRAGVPADVSKLITGHSRGKIHETYDRWKYMDEKADGLKRLAATIQDILTPPAANVVHLFDQRKHG